MCILKCWYCASCVNVLIGQTVGERTVSNTSLTNNVKYADKLFWIQVYCMWDGGMTSHSPMRTEESKGAWLRESGGMVTSRKERKRIDSSSAGRAGIFYCSSWRPVCWLPVPPPVGVENMQNNNGRINILRAQSIFIFWSVASPQFAQSHFHVVKAHVIWQHIYYRLCIIDSRLRGVCCHITEAGLSHVNHLSHQVQYRYFYSTLLWNNWSTERHSHIPQSSLNKQSLDCTYNHPI